MNMAKSLDEIQKENMDAAMKSFGAMSKAFQAIAVEFANYAKRSLEDHTVATEKLMAAKTLEKAIELQTEYVKTAYEGFVAHATKIGELYAISTRGATAGVFAQPRARPETFVDMSSSQFDPIAEERAEHQCPARMLQTASATGHFRLCGPGDAQLVGCHFGAFHAGSDFLEGDIPRDVWRTVFRLHVDAEGRETTVVG
jgi:hypothetical protein